MRSLLIVPGVLLAGALPASSELVLNELLPAPGSDWNGDGTYSSQDDEWVEVFNPGPGTADLAEYFVADADGAASPRGGADGLLAAGEYLYLTGELAADWAGAHGFPANGLSLNNSGDTVHLFRTAGGATTLVDSLTYAGSSSDVSLGRLPDGSGGWTEFDALQSGSGVQPTPGGPNGGVAAPQILAAALAPAAPTDADTLRFEALVGDTDGIVECLLRLVEDGGPEQWIPLTLAEGTVSLGTWRTGAAPRPAGTALTWRIRVSDGALVRETNDETVVVAGSDSPVVLNEILADPPPDLAGDANGDGVRHTSDDEFVELINRGEQVVDLSGWSLHDGTAVRHEFPTGTVLAPGELYVVFGGGAPAGIPAASDVASTGGLSLNNSGDSVQLLGADGVGRDVHVYGGEANADQSLIRVPDGTGGWTRPGDAGFGWAYTAGLLNQGPSVISRTSWSSVKALYRR